MPSFFRSVLMLLLLITFPAVTFISADITKDLSKLLPDKIDEWNLKGKSEIYKGDDLFLYINGGADIYHEYGFREVISSEYEKVGAGRISVEVYLMNDPVSAFGIFSFRTGGKWERTSSNNLSSSDGYYLNLLAGNFLITITSLDINEETGRGINVIRKFLEGNISIPADGKMPIPTVVPNIIRKINAIKYPVRIYFEGDMGLMNNYNLFSAESGILWGAAGSGKGSQIILLEFPSGNDHKKTITFLLGLLKKEGRYSDFSSGKNGIHFSDRQKNWLMITEMGGYIVIFIETNLDKCFDSAENFNTFFLSFPRVKPDNN